MIRRVAIVALALVVLVTASIVVVRVFVLPPLRKHFDSWFEAAEYPQIFAGGGWARYGLPATLPANATDVIIYAPGSAPQFFPVLDQYVEVRFLLPPADAESFLAVSQASALPGTSYSSMLSNLRTADDRDPYSQLPATFQHVILANPGGSNVGGVSVNPESGEVVYWIFEF